MMQLSAPLLQLAAASLGGANADAQALVIAAAMVPPEAEAEAAAPPAEVSAVEMAAAEAPAVDGADAVAPEPAPASATAPEQLDLFAPVQLAQADVPAQTDTPAQAEVPAQTAPDWTLERVYTPTPGGPNADDPLLEGRRVPGYQEVLPDAPVQNNIGAVRAPPPEAFPTDHILIPDRWRLIQSLGVVKERWWDPYNQNTLKGDRPLCLPTDEEQARRKEAGIAACATPKFLGLKTDEWFVVASGVSDTVIEPRSFPIPVGIQYPNRPGSNDVFGRNDSIVLAQTFIASAALIKGMTAYKPPDVEWRLTLAFNANYVDVPEKRVLFIEPTKGTTRFDSFVGVQEAFLDYHFKNTSDRFDFYSGRIGIQPLQLDFRGFLFNDQQLSVRLFGNRDNNRIQYNLIGIWRLEKDTNSGLNDITQSPRKDWVLHANIYRQDFPIVGLTSEASVTWNINRERNGVQVDDNGFPVRPALIGNLKARNYDIVYLGYGVDGRIGRINLSAQAYAALGSDRNNVFTGRKAEVRSFFFAAEPSYDVDWARFRGSFLFASGDGDPFDDTERGFDAIFENPIFAGADTSYWIRQTIPFIGGGRAISLAGRNGVLNTLRSSKEEGQSNFANPGTILAGVGADFDITPKFRLSANLNHLWFHKTQILQTLRSEGSIPRDIGWDASLAAIWRPKAIQNVVFRASGAVLQPGGGFRDLFENRDRDKRYYSVLLNAILTY